MDRPVWLLSLDSDTFPAAPMTTGGLKAYYEKLGQHAGHTDIQLVHFSNDTDRIAPWLTRWRRDDLERAQGAAAQGLQPVMGFSVYTWNAAEFLELMRQIKALCPELLIVAGGPHVQKAEDYLFSEAIDVIVLGEGEATFSDFLDTRNREEWSHVAGLAFVREGDLISTAKRPRLQNLDSLPSALDAISLCDEDGQPYECIAYETSRGCPYKCAFCEWGTGLIGTKMLTFSVERVNRDWNRIVDAGIKNIWLSDSNFGALREDVEKAKVLCEIKKRTGLPHSFATSWSKKHGSRSQEIVLMLHRNNLLPHYHLALQTLTPLALELSHRTNMAANKYEPIARAMAKARVPIACELIWGLIGDNLASFEKHLDNLFAVFPTIHIFGYTLLPGTEFYDRRDEYEIKTRPVAGYGKAKGEYVVGCMSFSEDEGLEGYLLVAAHIVTSRGYIMPMTLRYLALEGSLPVAGLMRAVLHELCAEFSEDIKGLEGADPMGVYELRCELFVTALTQRERTYTCAERAAEHWIDQHVAHEQEATLLKRRVAQLFEIDRAFTPRTGESREELICFSFDANRVIDVLEGMELPSCDLFSTQPTSIGIHIPGGVGDVIQDPDGAVWIRAERITSREEHAGRHQPVQSESLALPV
ncbi:MAG: cobalamin B12-binding domain-containing protein [Halioglobus sp.]|nr:cobalamin B12-binding domain-containing protein [Halioglobus sp.]